MKESTLRRTYLREATVMLLLARLALRIMPSARLFAWASRRPARIKRFAVDEIEWVSWSVETMGAKPWVNALCLPRALAAQIMLRRRGIVSRLCLGVARNGVELAAHAWIEIGQQMVVGGAEAAHYTRLAAFGGEPT